LIVAIIPLPNTHLLGTSLADWLNSSGHNLSITDKVTTIRRIWKGILHLHTNDVIHDYLAAENILIQHDLVAQIHGLVNYSATKSRMAYAKQVGCPTYIPPEDFDEGVKSSAVDVYTFGLLLFEIWNSGQLCNEVYFKTIYARLSYTGM
jgi:serine/threonine protein kinase